MILFHNLLLKQIQQAQLTNCGGSHPPSEVYQNALVPLWA